MFLVNFLRFFLIFSSMICGYGKHIALPCRYVCLKAFLILKVVMKLVIYAISQGPLLFNDFQSHPAFVEYHDLLEDLEEKLSSVVNLEEKWGLFWISNPRLWQQIVANWSNSMGNVSLARARTNVSQIPYKWPSIHPLNGADNEHQEIKSCYPLCIFI